MKHQILKSVACMALLSLISVGAKALEASDGIEGYRGGLDASNFDVSKWTEKGTSALENKTQELSNKLGGDLSSITNASDKYNPSKILELGGVTDDFIKKANDGASSFKVLDGGTFSHAGTTGDRWLDEFYGKAVDKNLDQYLTKDFGSDALNQQLGQASSDKSSSVDEYNDNARETYIRAAIAQAIFDHTGYDNGDLWMVDYVPAVAAGQVLVNKDENLGITSSITKEQMGTLTADKLGISQEKFDAIDWSGLDLNAGLAKVTDKANEAATSAKSKITDNEYAKEAQGLLSAASNIKDAATSMEDFSKMSQDFSFGDANEVNDIADKLMDNATEEAQRMLSTDALRFMNADAMADMNEQKDQVSVVGAGIPTMDILNLIVGMFNVDSVYATMDQNATGHLSPIPQTTGIQVGEFKSCVTSGRKAKDCCKIAAGDTSADSKLAEGSTTYKDCCVAMTGKETCPELKNQEKANCLEEQTGGTLAVDAVEDKWKTCDIQCKNTDFGDLIHRKVQENGELEAFSEEMIDDLLEECGSGESDWMPSPTVLTSAEMAAVVPETIKEYLIK